MVTIKRAAAIGDILMVTPIVQALKYKYGRVSLMVTPSLHNKIHGLLNSPALHVVREPAGEVIDLNNAYELRPHLHPVEAYCEVAGISPADTTRAFCNARYSPADGKFDVLIHATVSWPNRTLPRGFWAELVTSLRAEGLTVACVAQNTNEIVENCDAIFLGRALPEVAGLMAHAGIFIGGDSGPLHLAATTQTPIIGLFTIAEANLRRPWKRLVPFMGMESAVDCVGCLHRAPQPCSFLDCEFSDGRKHRCLNGFSIPEIVGKALTLHNLAGS